MGGKILAAQRQYFCRSLLDYDGALAMLSASAIWRWRVMNESERIRDLQTQLADEKLRAEALAAELDKIRALPSWQVVEALRLRGRRMKRLARLFRHVAVFFLRLMPGYGLRKPISPARLQALKSTLRDSRLFVADWYAKRHHLAHQDAEEHFLLEGGAGADPGPLFDSNWYRQSNPDIGTVNPLVHFMETGAAEGRTGWSMQRALDVQRPYIRDPGAALDVLKEAGAAHPFVQFAPGARISVYASSQGNSFFSHLRGLLVRGLCEAGFDAVPADENSPGQADGSTPLIIAPHEFYYLGRGRKLRESPHVQNALYVNTEQLHTSWFARAWPYLARARGVLDFNVQGAAILALHGIPARFLSPGFVARDPVLTLQQTLPDEPATQSFGPAVLAPPPAREAPLSARPLDILFAGASTPRREQFFARAAARLAGKACAIHLTDMSRPITDGGGIGLSPRAYAGLSQRAKIQLNIHQGALPYFEWHRMILYGFWQRTAVVTETGFLTPDYTPGVDYFEADLEDIPDLLDWLLHSEDGAEHMEKTSTSAFEKLRAHSTMAHVLRRMFLEGGAGT